MINGYLYDTYKSQWEDYTIYYDKCIVIWIYMDIYIYGYVHTLHTHTYIYIHGLSPTGACYSHDILIWLVVLTILKNIKVNGRIIL